LIGRPGIEVKIIVMGVMPWAFSNPDTLGDLLRPRRYRSVCAATRSSDQRWSPSQLGSANRMIDYTNGFHTAHQMYLPDNTIIDEDTAHATWRLQTTSRPRL
jgi:hypothetical protein